MMRSRTPQEVRAVAAKLDSMGGVWTAQPPSYEQAPRAQLLRNLDDVAKAVLDETDADSTDVNQAYAKSEEFVHSAFDFFEGKRSLGRNIGRAFCVPMRSDRTDEANASESTPFYPLYDPVRFGVNPDKRMRAMYGLPPTVLDTYTQSGLDDECGALVLVPMYSNMIADIWPDRTNAEQAMAMAKLSGSILTAATQFAHLRLGAKVLGLGAILPHPSITNFGRHLHAVAGTKDLVTTTGHGGTVFMIVETINKVLSETSIDSHGVIGVIGGAGSIGWSTTVAALEAFPDHSIVSYDRRDIDITGHSALSGRVRIADSAAEVLHKANIVVAAVTGKIDLDSPEFDDVDLADKVIIDDSQPGCFAREQVEAKSGKLIWVVGDDGSQSRFMTRDGLHTGGVPYNYGDRSGLHGASSDFPCGQEAAVIAKFSAYDSAIRGPVTPRDVTEVGKLLRAAGARVAPFQSYGQSVTID